MNNDQHEETIEKVERNQGTGKTNSVRIWYSRLGRYITSLLSAALRSQLDNKADDPRHSVPSQPQTSDFDLDFDRHPQSTASAASIELFPSSYLNYTVYRDRMLTIPKS